MARVLVVHRSEAAIDREAVARLVAQLCVDDPRVIASHELVGPEGALARFEREAADADRILLVDPLRWWTRGPAADALEHSLRERVEFCLANEVEQFAVVHDARGESAATLSDPLAALPSFVLPRAWPELRRWLERPLADLSVPNTDALLRGPAAWIERPELEAALDRAIADRPDERGRLVWIRGGIGTGKTALLARHVARERAKGRAPIVCVAHPGLPETRRPGAVIGRIVAALGLDDGQPAPTQLAEPATIVIDGLEQLTELQQLAAVITLPLPPNLTIIVASRPLAPGLLGEREPDIDLDGPRWAEAQRRLVAQLIGERPDRAALLERAGSNPAAALALAELRGATLDEHELPARLFPALERAFVRLRALPAVERRPTLDGLALVCAAEAPLPRSLLLAALDEPGLAALERHAGEWLRADGEALALAPAFARAFLFGELGDLELEPHVRLLDAAARLRRRPVEDLAAERYLAAHEQAHRQAARGLAPAERPIRSLARLRRAAGEGSLESQLDGAVLAARPEHAPLLACMRDAVRRRSIRLAEQPDALPSLLWAQLVARGFTPEQLMAELDWRDAVPPIRLQNRLDHVDESHRILAGHPRAVRACGINHDASLAITVCEAGELRVWQPQTGEQLGLIDLGGWCQAAALIPDGSRVVAAASGKVMMFDPRSQTKLAEHADHAETVTALAISPDGVRVVSGDRSGAVVLWDLVRGRRERLDGHEARVGACAISADGELAATGGGEDNRVIIWSLDELARKHTLGGHSYGVNALAFVRRGPRLVSICIGEARVWDPLAGRELARFDDLGQSSAGMVAVAGGRELLMAEAGERVTRWTLDGGEVSLRHLGHPVDMHCIAATPDGEWYLTGGADRVARVWRRSELRGGEPLGYVLPVSSLAPAAQPDCAWMSVAGKGLRKLELPDARPLAEARFRSTLALAEHRGRLYTSQNREIVVYASDDLRELDKWAPHRDWMRAIAVNPETGELACGCDDGSISVHAPDGAELRSLARHGDWVRALAFAGAGRMLSVGDDGKLIVWGRERPRVERKTGAAALYALAVDAPGDHAVVAGVGGLIERYELDTGTRLRDYAGHDDSVKALAIGLGDRVLASAGDDATLRLWSLADGHELARFDADAPLTHVAFVGERLVAGDAVGNLMIFAVDWATIAPA